VPTGSRVDHDVYTGVEQALSRHIHTIYREPWGMVEFSVGPILHRAMARPEGYRFANAMLDTAKMLDTFAVDAATVAAAGGEPREVSQRLNLQLDRIKTYVNTYSDRGPAQAAALKAISDVQAQMDWDYLEENTL
jgi:hypothetical protein